MGECGCGAMTPYEVLKINGNKYIVVEKYKGCNYCSAPIGVSLYFFNKKGFDEWLFDIDKSDIIEISFDEYASDWNKTRYDIGFFGEDEMKDVAKKDFNFYSTEELCDDGLDFLRDCISEFETKQEKL